MIELYIVHFYKFSLFSKANILIMANAAGTARIADKIKDTSFDIFIILKL